MSTNTNRERIEVDPKGDWRQFVAIKQAYQKPYGTIKVGPKLEGALFFDEQLDAFVMVANGATRELNQRKVRGALKLPGTMGQPLKGYEARELYSVRLEPGLAKYARELGSDNLSEGINRILREHRERAAVKAGDSVTFPDREPMYLGKRAIKFIALRGDQVVDCEITGEALRDCFGAASMKIADLLAAFEVHKEEIHRVARERLEAGENDVELMWEDFKYRAR